MKLTISRLLCGAVILAAGAGTSAAAHAQTAPAPATDPFVVRAQLKFQGTDIHNGDLGTDDGDHDGLLGTEGKLRVTANISDNALFYWEGRGVAGIGEGGFESTDTGSIARKKSFLEWRESYFEFNDLGGQPYYVRAGRQRVKEDYGNWWNQNFDAVRFGYNSTLFNGFLLAGQNMFSYNNSEDFRKDDKDIFRVLAEGSWQYHYQQFFETRFMYQDDHSGIGDVGDVEAANDRDQSEGNLFWGGVRAAGQVKSFMDNADKIKYRVDLMGVTGNEDFTVTAPAGSSSVVITDTDDRDVMGWAFDAGVDVPLALSWRPSLHLGYAYGSGDNGTGSDSAFRQSGLEGNFSRTGVLSQSAQNYGTVLRPDLSNLHILSAGFTMPLFTASDAGVIYHYYRLSDDATGLISSGVNDTLTGNSHDVGQAIDLLFNTSLYEREQNTVGQFNSAYLRTSLGAFRAGDAYGTNEGEIAGRALVEVGLNF